MRAQNDLVLYGGISQIEKAVFQARVLPASVERETSKGRAGRIRRPSTSTFSGIISTSPVGSFSLGEERRTTVPSTDTVDSVGISRICERQGSSEQTTCITP